MNLPVRTYPSRTFSRGRSARCNNLKAKNKLRVLGIRVKKKDKSNDDENVGVEENLPTPLENEEVKGVEEEAPYVSPPPYNPPIPFL